LATLDRSIAALLDAKSGEQQRVEVIAKSS
jgi:hypothetical protein